MGDKVAVVGEGVATGVPDRATISAEVAVVRRDVGQAMDRVAEVVTAAHERLEALGIAARDRHTVTVTLWPEWDDQHHIVGYRCSQQLRITCRQVEAVGEALAALGSVSDDDLIVNGVSLDIADPQEIQDRARENAFADAERKARQLAELAGRELGEVEQVIEGHVARGGGGGADLRMMAMSPMPVEPGSQEVTCSISVTWQLR